MEEGRAEGRRHGPNKPGMPLREWRSRARRASTPSGPFHEVPTVWQRCVPSPPRPPLPLPCASVNLPPGAVGARAGLRLGQAQDSRAVAQRPLRSKAGLRRSPCVYRDWQVQILLLPPSRSWHKVKANVWAE